MEMPSEYEYSVLMSSTGPLSCDSESSMENLERHADSWGQHSPGSGASAIESPPLDSEETSEETFKAPRNYRFYQTTNLYDENAPLNHVKYLCDLYNEGRYPLLDMTAAPDSTTPYSDIVNTRKKLKEGQIRRPMNAFMAFAQAERNTFTVAVGQATGNSRISQHLGKTWKLLPGKIKDMFQVWANKLKAYHNVEFPTYKYKPRKKKSAQQQPETSEDGDNPGTSSPKAANKRVRAPRAKPYSRKSKQEKATPQPEQQPAPAMFLTQEAPEVQPGPSNSPPQQGPSPTPQMEEGQQLRKIMLSEGGHFLVAPDVLAKLMASELNFTFVDDNLSAQPAFASAAPAPAAAPAPSCSDPQPAEHGFIYSDVNAFSAQPAFATDVLAPAPSCSDPQPAGHGFVYSDVNALSAQPAFATDVLAPAPSCSDPQPVGHGIVYSDDEDCYDYMPAIPLQLPENALVDLNEPTQKEPIPEGLPFPSVDLGFTDDQCVSGGEIGEALNFGGSLLDFFSDERFSM